MRPFTLDDWEIVWCVVCVDAPRVRYGMSASGWGDLSTVLPLIKKLAKHAEVIPK